MATNLRILKAVSDETRRIFDRSVQKILDEIYAHETRSIEDALKLLNELRIGIIGEISQGGSSAFDLLRMQTIQAGIEVRGNDFQAELNSQLSDDLNKAFDLGIKVVEQPIQDAGLSHALYGISREAVQVAEAFSADLIQGLTDDVRSKINGILRKGVFGIESVTEMIDEVGTSLSSEGTFKSIASRAENIVRTEVLRIGSIATQARQTARAADIAQAGYELRKSWSATMDDRTRETHAQADEDYAVGGEPGPIPIDQMFTVGDEEAMFPRDPNLSAEESCQCRCSSVSVLVTAT